MKEQNERNIREGKGEPEEPLEQYKAQQLRHFLKSRRCGLKGNKQDLTRRLRTVLEELRRFPGMPVCSQLQCYRRIELQTYLRERGAETKGSKQDMVVRLRTLLEAEKQNREQDSKRGQPQSKTKRSCRSFLKRVRRRLKRDKKYAYKHTNRNYRAHKEGSPDYRDGPYHGA